MRLLDRRTTFERLVEPVAKLPDTVLSNVPEVRPPKAVKSGLFALGGLLGLTAGSAAVSARRRRTEGDRHGR
jgi:hypothetical protein